MHGHKHDVVVLVCELDHLMHPSTVVLHSDKSSEDSHSIVYMDNVISYRKRSKVIDGKLLALLHGTSDTDPMEPVLVTPEQAELLAHYNSVTTIHFSLVYRGETDKADAYIKVQDDYLKKNPIDNTPKETEEENNG